MCLNNRNIILQVFPNWVKKVTIPIFLISFLISHADDAIKGFRNGYSDQSYNYIPEGPSGLVELFVGGGQVIHILEVISLLMILIYVLSKEKIEDDYIKKLSLESNQLSFLLIIILAIVLYSFGINNIYGLEDSVGIFMTLYLVFFSLKKEYIK